MFRQTAARVCVNLVMGATQATQCECVRWSVTLSVMLAGHQSCETQLQLQALPPNGGSLHECVCVCVYACECVCVGDSWDEWQLLTAELNWRESRPFLPSPGVSSCSADFSAIYIIYNIILYLFETYTFLWEKKICALSLHVFHHTVFAKGTQSCLLNQVPEWVIQIWLSLFNCLTHTLL